MRSTQIFSIKKAIQADLEDTQYTEGKTKLQAVHKIYKVTQSLTSS